MKNPIEPNLKTEIFAMLIIILSVLSIFYFRVGLLRFWPLLILAVYLMFLLFPYLKINRRESARLKDDWHKAKDLSLSFLFAVEIVEFMILSGASQSLRWALPILLFLLIIWSIVEIRKIIKYRQQ